MKKILSSPPFYLFLAVLFLFTLFIMERKGEDTQFVFICNSILKNSYEKDSLSCQFSFHDSSQFGISDESVALPCYNQKDYLNSREQLEISLASLKNLTPDRLSVKARTTYDILITYLEGNLKGCEFPYYEEPLSPTSGIHISLPILLAEFPIENEGDLQKYLSILSLIPSYFESLANFEMDKAAEDMIMSGEDVALVVSQCDFFASDKGLDLFRECFQEDLNMLFPENSQKQRNYLSQHESLLTTQVGPAYTKLGDSLALLKEPGKPRKGLCQYEKGQEYYEYHLQQLIGTDASTKEILQKLQTRLLALYEELSVVQNQYLRKQNSTDNGSSSKSGETDKAASGRTELQIKTGDYLPIIQKAMSPSFPTLPGSSSVTIKQIPDALADYTAPAYYFTPCISLCREGDTDSIKNVIYVGKDAKENPEELFTTLAHEGYPGHMYQNVYFISSQGVSRKNVLRYCMDFPGYSEGWAMYVELLSYEHAGSLYGLSGDGTNTGQTTASGTAISDQNSGSSYLQLLRLSREIQLCLLCMLDIGIHNDGATVEDISPYLAGIGIKEPSSIENVYSYLINEPGTYLKYYMGYLELLECKELYQKHCEETDESFSDLAFHTFFLSHGPDSYTNIKKAIP